MSEIIIDGVDVEKCEKHPNRYYKQLKRAEKENENLKGKIIDMNSIIEDIAISLEDRNLKLTEMPFKINDIRIKMLKYTQALEEMREIAKIHCKACDEFEIKRKLINCPYCNYNKILNKIDEVLND